MPTVHGHWHQIQESMKVCFTDFLVLVTTATSFEPVFGNIDVELGLVTILLRQKWWKLDLFSSKIKIFTSKIDKNKLFSLVDQFVTQPCVLWHKNSIKPKRMVQIEVLLWILKVTRLTLKLTQPNSLWPIFQLIPYGGRSSLLEHDLVLAYEKMKKQN